MDVNQCEQVNGSSPEVDQALRAILGDDLYPVVKDSGLRFAKMANFETGLIEPISGHPLPPGPVDQELLQEARRQAWQARVRAARHFRRTVGWADLDHNVNTDPEVVAAEVLVTEVEALCAEPVDKGGV